MFTVLNPLKEKCNNFINAPLKRVHHRKTFLFIRIKRDFQRQAFTFIVQILNSSDLLKVRCNIHLQTVVQYTMTIFTTLHFSDEESGNYIFLGILIIKGRLSSVNIYGQNNLHRKMASLRKLYERKRQPSTFQFVKDLMYKKAMYEEKPGALIKENGQNATIFPTSLRDQMITDILQIQSDGPKSCCSSKDWSWWRKKAFQEAQNKWTNVTQEACHLFLTLCEECHKKRTRREKTYEENESIAEETLPHRDQAFIKAREEPAAGQSRAAAKMTRRSTKILKPLHIGQNATFRVPDVDPGPADLKNFLVVVMAEYEGLYTVGCRKGKLSCKFAAADLQVISENLLSVDEVSDAEIPLRTAVTKATGGQGYVKCMYSSGCFSGRCSCGRKRPLCNSRCHPREVIQK
ncbi:conserved hypothetical protein [Trichinella spiralis]|uniref:hypothetical protein n=1 Tax=Trichinella spiralis TaxID=6334 RepID=UPI0001EFB881|nr:conserved hypothetical protein [Trichinella spiralis]